MRETKDRNKKKNPLWILLVIILLAAVAVIGIFAAKGKDEPQQTAKKPVKQVQTSAEEEQEDPDKVKEGQGTEDFVIFGVDTRSNNLGKGTRSDSIMILHVDHDAKTVKVASIYRDCMLHIEGHDYQKVTHAHSFGGPELALQTINENLDLDIEHYMTVNFINVADLIDKIGGVEQDITEEEAGVINGSIDELNGIRGTDSAHINVSGSHLLDGTQAVAYSRIRYASGGDYKRAERQRTILFSVFEKAKTLSAEDRIALAEDMLEEINSNYRSADLTSLLYYLSKYEITEMGAYPQVFYGGTVDGAWVEVPVTLIDMSSAIHEFLYGDTEYTPSETVQGYSSVLQGKAGTANQDLRDSGEE